MKSLNCILLIDDNAFDNFYHERVIRNSVSVENIVVKESGTSALEFLQNKENHINYHPDLIFLDINMPGMNGWEFLVEYEKMPDELKSKIIIVMLTTSSNPDDELKAHKINFLSAYLSKPLLEESIKSIVLNHF